MLGLTRHMKKILPISSQSARTKASVIEKLYESGSVVDFSHSLRDIVNAILDLKEQLVSEVNFLLLSNSPRPDRPHSLVQHQVQWPREMHDNVENL
jgi:hypothetical protein